MEYFFQRVLYGFLLTNLASCYDHRTNSSVVVITIANFYHHDTTNRGHRVFHVIRHLHKTKGKSAGFLPEKRPRIITARTGTRTQYFLIWHFVGIKSAARFTTNTIFVLDPTNLIRPASPSVLLQPQFCGILTRFFCFVPEDNASG